MNLLRDRKFQMSKGLIAFLQMRRNRIVNQGLHTMFGEILLQFITSGTKNRKKMIDIIIIRNHSLSIGESPFFSIFEQNRIGTRHTNQRIVNLLIIKMSYHTTMGIVGIQVLEFNIQHSRLNLVHTRIAPLVLENIFLLTSIVRQSTNHGSQFLIVGRHGSRIAQGAKVFAGIETMPCSIP